MNVMGRSIPIGVAIFLYRLNPIRVITPLMGPFHGESGEQMEMCFFMREVTHFSMVLVK